MEPSSERFPAWREVAMFWAINPETGDLILYRPAREIAKGNMEGRPKGYVPVGEVAPEDLLPLLPRILEQILEGR
jgi:hypothetical protein